MDPSSSDGPRRLATAEILSIGTELTTGETRDTNAGELARWLTTEGVVVGRLTALPDRRASVEAALAAGARAGRPRRHDRRPRAHARRPHPRVDRRAGRRGAGRRSGARALAARAVGSPRDAVPDDQPQAGLAHPVGRGARQPERNGTRLVGRPPRRPGRRRPAWAAARDASDVARRGAPAPARARPRRRPGRPHAAAHRDRRIARRRPARRGAAAGREPGGRHLRPGRRGRRPDVRGRRAGRDGADGATADELLDEVEPVVLAALGEHVWARGQTTWPEAMRAELERLGWTLAAREIGLGGALCTLLGGLPMLRRAELLPASTAGRRRTQLARRRGGSGCATRRLRTSRSSWPPAAAARTRPCRSPS